MRICVVTPLYGENRQEREALCSREITTALAERHSVTVLASCAANETWSDVFPDGEQADGRVRVIRFAAENQRSMEEFAVATGRYLNKRDRDFYDDFAWLGQAGPVCPGLFRYIKDNRDAYDVFFFVGYLHWTAGCCMYAVAEQAVLVPVLGRSELLDANGMFAALFNLPAALLFRTAEETAAVHGKFGNAHIPYEIAGGSGMGAAAEKLAEGTAHG